jgi:hypothetical protein
VEDPAAVDPRQVDRDRLGDRQGAEAARIDSVDRAAFGRLADRPGQGLARRRPAAGLTSSPTPETQVRVA